MLTYIGYVKVTEDHSLLDKNSNRIKPNDCLVGTELLHSFPKTNVTRVRMDTGKIKLTSQLEAMREYYLMKKEGFYVSVDKDFITGEYILSFNKEYEKFRRIKQHFFSLIQIFLHLQ